MMMTTHNPWCKSFIFGINDTVRISFVDYTLYIFYYILCMQLFIHDILYCSFFVLKIPVYIFQFQWGSGDKQCMCVCDF